MGFHCRDNLQFVHVILMTPDGRLLAMRPPNRQFEELWQVTVTRPVITRDFNDEAENTIQAATMAVFTRFAFRPTEDDLSRITCHYSSTLKKIMHLYICKIPSGKKLICSGFTQIRVMTLERVSNELYTNPEDFAVETEEAINLIGSLKDTSEGAS